MRTSQIAKTALVALGVVVAYDMYKAKKGQ
jgi:hypothetical protein